MPLGVKAIMRPAMFWLTRSLPNWSAASLSSAMQLTPWIRRGVWLGGLDRLGEGERVSREPNGQSLVAFGHIGAPEDVDAVGLQVQRGEIRVGRSRGPDGRGVVARGFRCLEERLPTLLFAG